MTMPETERDALRAAVQAHKVAIVRRPLPLDLLDEIEQMAAERKVGG